MLGCQSRRLTSPSANEISPSPANQRDQWPADNGTACLCYDTLNAECIATCAAGIRNYSIRRSSGTGLVFASCPRGTMVLGCGSASPTSTDQSKHRAAVVAMRTSCRCYDDHEVTCYAACGLFTADSSYPGSFQATRLLVPTVDSSAIKRCSKSAMKTAIICMLGFLLAYYKQTWMHE